MRDSPHVSTGVLVVEGDSVLAGTETAVVPHELWGTHHSIQRGKDAAVSEAAQTAVLHKGRRVAASAAAAAACVAAAAAAVGWTAALGVDKIHTGWIVEEREGLDAEHVLVHTENAFRASAKYTAGKGCAWLD